MATDCKFATTPRLHSVSRVGHLANRARQAAEIAAGAELIESARAHVLWTFLFTDAELAQLFNVSVHTIPDWKKIKWTETIRSLSGRQIGETFDEVRAMAPAARNVLFEL